MGVWIETWICVSAIFLWMSHPVWVCGLKLFLLLLSVKLMQVTPCMGVWIETPLPK